MIWRILMAVLGAMIKVLLAGRGAGLRCMANCPAELYGWCEDCSVKKLPEARIVRRRTKRLK